MTKKSIIYYEQFISGAILKFKTIDNIDFSLLTEDFIKKTDCEFIDRYNSSKNGIYKYIEIYSDKTIALRNGVKLDDFIEDEQCTLKEKLINVAGDIVNSYFDELDIELFKKNKEKALLENKEKVLNEANVLLISEREEDYKELIKYGFKNVDYFKSIIRADAYFKNYPEELKKYHIIIKGKNIKEHCGWYDYKNDFEINIEKLKEENHVIEISLNIYYLPYYTEFCMFLDDYKNKKNWFNMELSYSDVFDRIVENNLVNKTLEIIPFKHTKYNDYINPNRLLIPSTKKDLKILYLTDTNTSEIENDIAQKLGLNITFRKDNNSSIEKNVINNLGDYDIIISSKTFSKCIVRMNNESTEQCKDTGRNLTLLVNYNSCTISQIDEDTIMDDLGIGNRIDLEYSFGGTLAPTSKVQQKQFRVLRQQIEIKNNDINTQNKYCNMQSIIDSAVSLYNEALIQTKKGSITDIDLKTSEDYDKEYEIIDKKEKKRINIALEPIRQIDRIRYQILQYLDYRKKGFITKTPEGLKITEGENGIKVENMHLGRTLCSIILPKENKKENLRIFDIQTMSKKGVLTNPQTIGVYTRKYENLSNIPNRPNEQQLNAINSIEKKVNCTIKSLNEEACNKKYEKQKIIIRY